MDLSDALGKEEEIDTTDLQREDIEVLNPDSIKLIKAVRLGKEDLEEICRFLGWEEEKARQVCESLQSRGFLRLYTRKVKLTKKGQRLFVKKFDFIGPGLVLGFIVFFFLGVVEFARFSFLFAPLRFSSEPSGFWILFYSNASWLDFIGMLVFLLISMLFAYASVERMYKSRVMRSED